MSDNKSTEHWYDIVEKDLEIKQGDLLDSFPVPFPTSVKLKGRNGVSCDYKFLKIDAVVITQSCDLTTKVKSDNDQVVVCPRIFLANIYQSKTQLSKDWNPLVRDQVIDKLLIDKFQNDELSFGYSFIDFSKIYVAPYSYVSDFANVLKRRVRMNSPYRERLSQAFARKFMRIGLPIDISREVPDLEFNSVTTYGNKAG